MIHVLKAFRLSLRPCIYKYLNPPQKGSHAVSTELCQCYVILHSQSCGLQFFLVLENCRVTQ